MYMCKVCSSGLIISIMFRAWLLKSWISANQIPSQSLPRTVNIKWTAPLLVEFDITTTPMSSIVHNYVGQCSIGPDALVDNNVTCGNAQPRLCEPYIKTIQRLLKNYIAVKWINNINTIENLHIGLKQLFINCVTRCSQINFHMRSKCILCFWYVTLTHSLTQCSKGPFLVEKLTQLSHTVTYLLPVIDLASK